jgi:SAM-dependent methyltransferase
MNTIPWFECRLCGNKDFVNVADLGVQAISCRYPATEDEEVPTAPLQLMHCPECNLGQLTVSLPSEEMYRTGYGYRSGQTDTMRAHLADLARDSVSRLGIHREGDIALDIGCNDGTLLKALPARFRRLGMDPIARDFDWPGDLEAIYQLFSAEEYRAWMNEEPVRLVTAIAMFYDLDDPVGFLREIESILAPDGIVVLEFMYLRAMIDGAWDQISHEHVCYHSLSTVEFAAEKAGLEVADFSDQAINGGSLRVYLQRPDGPLKVEDARIANRIQNETSWDWSEIPNAIMLCIEGIRQFIAKANAAGKTVHVLGASQRGNVVLQTAAPFFGVKAAIERDERKTERFTPGTLIPIYSEQDRAHEAGVNDGGRALLAWADAYVVTPWQFKEEILRRERELGAPKGTQYLFPLPRPEVVTL